MMSCVAAISWSRSTFLLVVGHDRSCCPSYWYGYGTCSAIAGRRKLWTQGIFCPYGPLGLGPTGTITPRASCYVSALTLARYILIVDIGGKHGL